MNDQFFNHDSATFPVVRIGPRRIDPDSDTLHIVPSATAETTEFWGVERWHEPSETWEWIGDAHDEDSAQSFARIITQAYPIWKTSQS